MRMEKYEELKEKYLQDVLIYLMPENYDKWNIGGGLSFKRLSITISPNSLLKYKPLKKQNSESFVHFTSLRNLHSILNEQSIRMYNLNNVNDPNEVFFSLKDIITEDEIHKIRKKKYSLSLCSSRVISSSNILNLWRLYGYDGWGVAIEFEIFNNNPLTSFLLAKIVYNKLKLKKFREANDLFEKANNIKVDLAGLLDTYACLYKNKYYKIENEFRLLYSGEEMPAILTHSKHEKYKFDFNYKNEIVSYYSLKLFEDNCYNSLPEINIKKIHIGFQFDEKQFEKIKEHITEISVAIANARSKQIHFDIELSPLKNIYK